ncbi:hypothetical protein ACEQPO_09735 [Bacillus sp. SL00103]
MKKFGYVDPLVWNERTGHLVGGHQRFKVLMEDNPSEILVSVVSLNEQDEKALNIVLNKIDGEWDEYKLTELLKDLEGSGYDLSLTGFSDAELEDVLNGLEHKVKVEQYLRVMRSILMNMEMINLSIHVLSADSLFNE